MARQIYPALALLANWINMALPMAKICLLLLLAAALVAGGCASHSGSREYNPGSGWTPN